MTTPTILITGATSGLGLALAQQCHTAEYKLILLGRQPLAQLDPTLFTPATYCQADLSHTAVALPQLTDWLTAQAIPQIDYLVHNAGIGYYGDVAAQSSESIQQLLQTNLYAPIALTHALRPWLAQGKRHITFISSVASRLPAAAYATYAASKAALDGFARNLRLELGAEWTVQLIHPGAIATPMHDKVGLPVAKRRGMMPVEQAATAVFQAITQQPQHNPTLGAANQLLRTAAYLFPRPLERAMRLPTPPSRRYAPPQYPRHALVTGFADGIGRATAVALAQAGYHLTGLDFDPVRAAQTAQQIQANGGQITYHLVDLRQLAAVEAVAEAVSRGRPLDVLVHNAGISAVGAFMAQSLPPQLAVLDVNLTAPLVLTARLLQAGMMVEGGHIVLLSSLSAYVGYPGAAVYSASKDGLAAYGRALSAALAPHVTLHTVFPGPTRTAHAHRYSPDNSREARRLPPEKVAEAITTAVSQPHPTRHRHIFPGPTAKLFALTGFLAPALMEQLMVRTLFAKLK